MVNSGLKGLNRDCLWFKLLDCGLTGNIYNVIRSMHVEVNTRLRYGGETSKLVFWEYDKVIPCHSFYLVCM